MRHEAADYVVLGGAAGGTPIALALAARGRQVVVLDRGLPIASTLTNQKWKQSSALYEDGPMADRICAAFLNMHPLERKHILRPGAHFLVNELENWPRRQMQWRRRGLPFHPLDPAHINRDSALGPPSARSAAHVPDSVIDFPPLMRDAASEAARLGARICSGATVKRLERDGDAVRGVVYERDNREIFLECRKHCIVALGGWAPEVLGTIDVELPVRRWKCHLITLAGEQVERITAWLDGRRTTLVPYKGRTLVADTRRFGVSSGDDRSPIRAAVEALLDDLAGCFPALRWSSLTIEKVHACIKTEAGSKMSNPDLAVFDYRDHGVHGLTAVFPGKASLMFLLARHVVDQLTAEAVAVPA